MVLIRLVRLPECGIVATIDEHGCARQCRLTSSL